MAINKLNSNVTIGVVDYLNCYRFEYCHKTKSTRVFQNDRMMWSINWFENIDEKDTSDGASFLRSSDDGFKFSLAF